MVRYLPVLLAAALLAQEAGDRKERERTARDLGKQGSEAMPRLQAMLTDPEVDVRIEVVKSIVAIGTQRSLDPLVQAARDNDPEIQIRATDGLVNFYLPGYVQRGLTATLKRVGTAVRARFTDVNDQVIDPYVVPRADVIEALGRLARGGASMEVRANAARAVGVLRGRAAVSDLIEALRSKDDQVIYEVLVALQKIRDPEAAPRIAFLLRDLQEKVQISAIETTGLLQNKQALPDLHRVLAETRSSKVRRAALTAIAMLPDASSRDVYARFLKDRDDALRAAAAEGFARLRDAADLPMLESAFEEERKRNPRLSLAFALVLHGKTEMSEFSPLRYLIDTLNSKSYRGVARPFLIEAARDATVLRALYPAMASGTKDEKIELAEVLARSGDKGSIEALESLTKDSDPEVAGEAVRSLRNLKARLP